MLKQAHFALCALVLVVLGITTMTSCTPLLGIDTETKDNPCSTPGSDLDPQSCGVGVCHKFIDSQDICKAADGIPISCVEQTDKKQNIDTCLDGYDNDCDGAVDENDSGDCKCDDVDAQGHTTVKPCYTGSADVRGKGLCRDGKQPCQNGAWQQCTGDVLPSHEVHDGLDNNCNGEVDEEIPCTNGDDQECYSGPESTINLGTCQRGRQTCTNGKWGKCVGEVTPQLETCDDKDHDCDGVAANGPNCVCRDGDHQDCYTPKKQNPNDKTEGVGPCHKGYILCVNGKWDTDNCNGEITPVAEICNNQDDDCDGKIDNAAPGSGTECLPIGSPCKQANQCLSTYCVDGFCCDTACNGTCEACIAQKKGSGKDGTCGNIANGADPDDECASQNPTSCGTTGVCDGNGSCAKYGTSTVCRPASCSPEGTALLKAVNCNGNGFCEDKMSTPQDCSPYNCDNAAGACRTTCLNDTWCAPGLHCSGAGKCVQCNTPLDCSGQDTECQTRTCLAGVCGFSYAATGTPITNQTPGDCHENQCNGSGIVIPVVKNTDLPNDNIQCTIDLCSGGTPSHNDSPAGTTCSEKGGSVCNGFGQCVQCVNASTCPGQDTECQTRTCVSGVCGFSFTPLGTMTSNQTAGDCRENQCNGSGSILSAVKDADVPNDNNQCTTDTCNSGVPTYANLGAGAFCNQNNGSVCNGLGQCVQCVSAATCPGQDTECQQRTCTGGICGFGFAASGTQVSNQTAGNCQKNQCNGAGVVVSVPDNADVPNDNNQCTVDTCNNGVPVFTSVAAGTSCSQGGGSVCNNAGQCVQCVSASTCPGQDTECQFRTCTSGVCGIGYKPSGAPTTVQIPGDCREDQCNGAGTVVSAIKNSDVPNDGNQCTVDTCASGMPVYTPASSGTTCNQNGGSVCNSTGQCAQCVTAATCPGQDTECQTRTCTGGVCGFSFAMAGTPAVSQTVGDCLKKQCNGNGVIVSVADNTDVPNDNNQCTSDACNNGVPAFTPAASGTACTQSNGHYCDGGGTCVECVIGTQCPSQICSGNKCQAPSCTDGVKNGSEVEIDCGGGCTCANTLLLLASNSNGLVGADFHTNQWYVTSAIGGNGKTSDRVALAIHALTQKGVGLIRQAGTNDLRYTLWTGPSAWANFATIGSEKSFSAPALSALSSLPVNTYAVYQSNNVSTPTCKTQFFDGTGWSPDTTSYTDCTLPQLTVPSASTQTKEDVAFFTATELRSLYTGAPKTIAAISPATGNGADNSKRPMLITLFNGTNAVEDLVVWVEKTTGNILFSKSLPPGSNWSTPVQITTGVTTTVPVGLATVTDPTGAKKAVVAIQGPGNTLYTSFYDGSTSTWSMAVPLTGVLTITTPAITHGIGGALAEMVIIETDGMAYHVRYVNNTWTMPVAVGGSGLTSVTLASSP